MRISYWISDVCSSDLLRGIAKRGRDRDDRFVRVAQHVHRLLEPVVAQPGMRRKPGACLEGTAEVEARQAGIRSERSEKRREGKECVSTCRSRWSPDHSNKKSSMNMQL